MQTFVGLLVLSFALAANASPAVSRIIGGHEAPDGKYPYQAALYKHGKFHCGGSIINKRYILTAAHCLVNWEPSEITVSVGTQQLYDDHAQSYESEKFISHSGFEEFVGEDIGLIRLAEDIVFGDNVQPIELPTEDAAPHAHLAVLSGWGRLYAGGPIPSRLQEIDLKIWGLEKCRWSHTVTSKQICTFTQSGQGACNGDSGGPLVIDGVQVGLVSYGVPCGRGVPDVFTRVYSYMDWIAENMSLE